MNTSYLNTKQMDKLIQKLFKLATVYEPFSIKEKKPLKVHFFQTQSLYHTPPKDHPLKVINQGDLWGGNFYYGWFYLDIENETIDSTTYLLNDTDAVESLVFVNDQPYGMFDVVDHMRDGIFRKHRYLRLHKDVKHITINGYASHTLPGTMPYEQDHTFGLTIHKEIKQYKGIYLVTFHEEIKTFIEKLQFIESLYTSTQNKLTLFHPLFIELYKIIDLMPETNLDLQSIQKANSLMDSFIHNYKEKEEGHVYLLGHSHLDTAWLWPFEETKVKFIETVSTAVRLLKQYDNYKFMMSSILHFEWLRKDYPALFDEVIQLEKQGKFEINGATYVEPDCNLIGGESLVRQFVRGQRWMKHYTHHYADVFFMPDTFGYSSSIPQIMKQSNVTYFLTTKLRWNDTNKFPFNTFYWEGLDGSKVLTHFNTIHSLADPASIKKVYNELDLQQTNQTILTYGFGDGGGGCSEEMVKQALLSEQVLTHPKCQHLTLSQAMNNLNKSHYPTYTNELYLELHRATYTNNPKIKYLNRKLEFALHNAEFLSVNQNIDTKHKTDLYYDILMKNQFHDTLPATCINEVNTFVINENSETLSKTNTLINDLLTSNTSQYNTIVNLNGVKTKGTCFIQGNYFNQGVQLLDNDYTFFNLDLDSYETSHFAPQTISYSFNIEKDNNKIKSIETNAYKVVFDDDMFITRFYDKRVNRETVSTTFNQFKIAQNVPLHWDNWDMDKDYELKLLNQARLLSVNVVKSDGLVMVIETNYQLTDVSTLRQAMVFYHTPRIDFFTEIDWNDTHKVLKTYFDTTIHAKQIRSDIQFGYETRSMLNNTPQEQAQFEVMNHKWINIGEPNYNMTFLNDASYGLSAKHGTIGLTLVTGGTHPDKQSSKGKHVLRYAIILNNHAFNAQSILPSYAFNNPPMLSSLKPQTYMSVDKDNIIIETIKQGEEAGIILRLFESTGDFTHTTLTLDKNYQIYETNFLEEPLQSFGLNQQVQLSFKPFEIKTLMLSNTHLNK